MHPYLIPGLESSPKIFQALFERIDPALFDIPTGPGRFSPREVIAHLADWEPILRDERIRVGLEAPGSFIQSHDEGERATTQNYAAWQVPETLAKFAAERAKTVELVRGIPQSAWSNEVIHAQRGSETLGAVANFLLGHDLYHVQQLSELLR